LLKKVFFDLDAILVTSELIIADKFDRGHSSYSKARNRTDNCNRPHY